MLVVEKKTFMTGVQINGLKLTSCVCTNSLHEAKGLGDGGDDVRVFGLQLGISNVAKAPIKRTMQICNAGGDRCSDEVQCGCRVEICAASCQRNALRLWTVTKVETYLTSLNGSKDLSSTG